VPRENTLGRLSPFPESLDSEGRLKWHVETQYNGSTMRDQIVLPSRRPIRGAAFRGRHGV